MIPETKLLLQTSKFFTREYNWNIPHSNFVSKLHIEAEHPQIIPTPINPKAIVKPHVGKGSIIFIKRKRPTEIRVWTFLEVWGILWMVSGAEEKCLAPWKGRETNALQKASLISFRVAIAAINE